MTDSRRQLVVQTEALDPEPAQWLAERCRLVRCASTEVDFPRVVARAAGLIVRTYTEVDQGLLDRAPHLRVVARAGVGVDNIDVAACRQRGVEVVYAPDANTQAVGEFVLGVLLDVTRPRPLVRHAMPLDEWQQLRARNVAPLQLDELRLGILGFGRVGSRVARIANGLGMRVGYNDLLDIPAAARHGAEPMELGRLFEESDVLSIHVDGRSGNRGFVHQNRLERMKDGVILVNTSRGFVVDKAALAEFMRQHPAAIALLDVHEPEPIERADPLLSLDNVRLYPHVAGRSETALRNMSWVVRDVVEVLEGRTATHPAPSGS